MPAGALRAGDYGVIADGQSLTVWPYKLAPTSWPVVLMAGRPAPLGVIGIAGLAWQQLDDDVPTRAAPFIKMAPILFYVMCGGTTQIGLHQPAAGIYTSMATIANLVIAEAAVKAPSTVVRVIAQTTTPSTSFDGASNVILGDLNNLVRANSHGFAGVVNLDADAGLANPASSSYVDGTHGSTIGNAAIASLTGTVLDSLLP